MGGIFNKQKKTISRVTEQDKAILQLKQQRDKLKQYQRRLENSLENNIVIAKQLLAEKKRDKAKLILKKKRYQEQLISNTDKQLEGLERLVHDIEFAQIELKVVEGLKVGNEALKKVNNMLNIEDIEKIMDETKEGIEKQKEIEEIISGSFTEEDERAVEDELLDIIGETVKLPDVPNENLPEEEIVREKKKVAERIALEA